MPVVSHSHARKKCEAIGCRSSALCAWWRCRKIVTEAMVTWVRARATATRPHQGRSNRPEKSIGRGFVVVMEEGSCARFYANGLFAQPLNGGILRQVKARLEGPS